MQIQRQFKVGRFCIEKREEFACSNALEFSMTTVMSLNDDQDSVKISKAQSKTVAANEMVHYFAVTI